MGNGVIWNHLPVTILPLLHKLYSKSLKIEVIFTMTEIIKMWGVF